MAKLHMKEHIRKMSEEFKHSAELKDANKVSTPAACHLFEANQNCNELGDNRMEGGVPHNSGKCFVFVQKEQARFATCSVILVHQSPVSR